MNKAIDTPEMPSDIGFSGIDRLLDEFDAQDFRAAERLIERFSRQGVSEAQYPLVRPEDCRRVTTAVRQVFMAHARYFKLGDTQLIERFWAMSDKLLAGPIKAYPNEVHMVRILRAQASLACGDAERAIDEAGSLADQIYRIEGDREAMLDVLVVICRARLAMGDIEKATGRLIENVDYLLKVTPARRVDCYRKFEEFIGLTPALHPADGLMRWAMQRFARGSTAMRREFGSRSVRAIASCASRASTILGYLCLRLRRVLGEVRLRKSEAQLHREVIVTRAMGGIGDLAMMTPGLRILAARQGKPVKLAIRKAFFPIFQHNSDVELIDIDGPTIDVFSYRKWRNLSNCPAARYETRRRPFVRKTRIELFARGMGVRSAAYRSGSRDLTVPVAETDHSAAQEFLTERGIGRERPILGVQPYSRDSYKDHPDIVQIVTALAKTYDVLIFHHTKTPLDHLDGVCSTAGQPLEVSLSLVPHIDALLCVDSAFLHIAGAHRIPIVTMFGPTDGELFTREYENVTVLTEKSFACAPCWRNEDLPCQITGHCGTSPCIAAIRNASIMEAVRKAIGRVPATARPLPG